MKLEIPPLPYPKDALAPHVSARTVEVHYERHHRGYVDKTNALLRGSHCADASLVEIIRTADGDLFNNAAQVWNHDFYWRSMTPDGGGEPDGDLRRAIDRSFGSVDAFKREFAGAANGEFGSGWAWLVVDPEGRLRVQSSDDAENPLQQRDTAPLLTCDVWEHAYYLDYQNERARYVEGFLEHLLNWNFAAANLAAEFEERARRRSAGSASAVHSGSVHPG